MLSPEQGPRLIDARRALGLRGSPMLIGRQRAIPRPADQGLRAVRIAPRALESLRASTDWRVLSAHRHALNFVDSTGGLLSFVDGRNRMGPFSLEVELTPAEVGFDHRSVPLPLVFEDETRIRLGGKTLDLTSAEIWNPRPGWSALSTARWQPEFIPVILTRLRASAPSDSLACVVDLLTAHPARPDTDSRSLQGLPRLAAVRACIRLCLALAEDELPGVAAASAALAGLGPGLTPSGDDFLIGVVFGIQSGLPPSLAKTLASTISRASGGRTNKISGAWLAAAVEGQAVQAWHDLVKSILSADVVRVDRACQELLGVGHTSGADALAGFAAFHLRPESLGRGDLRTGSAHDRWHALR